MKHQFTVNGMTCKSCVTKVQQVLSGINGVTGATVSLEDKTARVEMSEHVTIETMNAALKKAGNYQLSDVPVQAPPETDTSSKPFFETYKPLLLVLAYLLGGVLLHQLIIGQWNGAAAMQIFMGGFFLVFSFFKMLDLQGFAMAYSSYDIVAKRWFAYGYMYPFIELGLGIAYVTGIAPWVVNAITLVVMSVSIKGVLQSVLNKRKIQCACLGTGFNLPMSTVTIIEDGTMILMAGLMLFMWAL